MGHTILLADDSITIQKVIELTFSDEDFTLHTVGNGQKAIDEIHSVRPDIVLCDIIMPEKNGYEVCEFIKSSDNLKHIPVLLLTGAFEPFDQERARSAGCDGFLAKPFEPQTLISKVKELLSSAERASPQTPVAEAPAPVPPAPAAPAAPTPSPSEPSPGSGMEPPTVEFSGMAGQPPVAEEPSVPSPPPVDEGATIMADNFAVEAGEKELTVQPDDQTVLLGGDETASVPAEDIWSEVQQPQEPSPSPGGEDESSTVFMSVPETSDQEPAAPPGAESQATSTSEFAEFVPPAEPPPPSEPPSASESDAWVLPSPDDEPTVQPAEPELTPLGEFGGFEDFSSSDPMQPSGADTFAQEGAAPDISAPGMAPPSPPEMPISELPLTSAPETGPEPPVATPPPEPTPPVEPEPPVAPPPEPTPPVEPEPPLAAPEPPAAAPPEPSPFVAPESPAAAPPEPKPPLAAPPPVSESPPVVEPTPLVEPLIESTPQPLEAQEPVFAEPQPPMEGAAPVPGEPEPPAAMPPQTGSEAAEASQDVDALVERVAERVIAKLSEHVIKEVAWEVVPDLAQTLIRKEIDALKAKIPK